MVNSADMRAPAAHIEQLLHNLAHTRDTSHPLKARVTTLEHSLQTATRAERAGAHTDLVIAALLHDIGRQLNEPHHGALAAALVRGRLNDTTTAILEHHSADQATAWAGHLPAHPLGLWDAMSFDPDYDTEPLSRYLPLLAAVWR